jgi:zinc/manganese transport system substrate-binding protein
MEAIMLRATTLALAALLAGVGSMTPAGAQAREPVRVVTTLPVYASIAESIGGPQVRVTAIADPSEDPHFVRPRPSYALELRRADLFVTTGLDLELWVPALLDKAGNASVLEGGRGYVTAYTGIDLLDIPPAADRSQGDVHVYGNPHLHTDPLRMIRVARNIATGLERVAPDRATAFRQGLARFEAEVQRRLFGAQLVEMLGGETLVRLAENGTLHGFLEREQFEGRPLSERLGGWLAAASSLRGARIVCYHKNWAYFEQRFGVTCAEYVETKPGIQPTPRHVAHLLDLMRNEGISVVLAASYFDSGRVESVARRGDARAVQVPMQPGARPGVQTYFDLVDLWIRELTTALAAR